MVRHWLRCCVLGYLALATVVSGQNYFYISGGSLDMSQNIGSATIVGQFEAIGQACQNVAVAINNYNSAWGATANALNASASVNMQASVSVQASLASAATALNGFAASAATMAAASTANTTAATAIANSATAIGNSLSAVNTSLTGVSSAMNIFRVAFTNALVNQDNQTKEMLATNIAPALYGIKDILATNGLAPQVTVMTTNGGTAVSITNIINSNVEVPSMTNMEAFAIRANAGALNVYTNPTTLPNFATLVSDAVAASPFTTVTVTPAIVEATVLPDDFMRVRIPGTDLWIDMNPMNRFPQIVNGFHTVFEWFWLAGFLASCGKLAYEYMVGVGTVAQPKAPEILILGNSAGAVTIAAYVVIYVSLAAIWATALGGLYNFSGTPMAGISAILSSNPFAGFDNAIVHLTTMFLPLQLIVATTVWMITNRWTLLGTHWITLFIIRRLP